MELQGFIILIKYRLLIQTYHRVVTDTQESHHFYVSRN